MCEHCVPLSSTESSRYLLHMSSFIRGNPSVSLNSITQRTFDLSSFCITVPQFAFPHIHLHSHAQTIGIHLLKANCLRAVLFQLLFGLLLILSEENHFILSLLLCNNKGPIQTESTEISSCYCLALLSVGKQTQFLLFPLVSGFTPLSLLLFTPRTPVSWLLLSNEISGASFVSMVTPPVVSSVAFPPCAANMVSLSLSLLLSLPI